MSRQDDLIRVNTLLLECVRIMYSCKTKEEDTDVMLSINALSTQLADLVQRDIAKKQVCPGPYWRLDLSFQVRLAEKNQSKKRKTNPKTTCTAKHDALNFDKGGQGPSRLDDGPRRLCNLCYQTLVRDQGAGLFEK